MNSITSREALVVADLTEGSILGSVQLAASPERVFHALTSEAIIDWWVRPGVFDTTDWKSDVRIGGRWQSSGMFIGTPYTLEGEYLEIDPPRKLVLTYGVGAPWGPTTVTYLLEALETGTQITLRHSGFTVRENCAGNCIGWETSFEQLAKTLQKTED